MWVVGDWGQDSPWSRDTGVKMVKGADDVYTGELLLTKGTKFDIKILKSTVSTTSGGDNTWSAVRYASTLNKSASHDFGEFTDNLIPNGNFNEGQVKWTPAECIGPFEGENWLMLGNEFPDSCTSDMFVMPPNQTLRLTGYIRTWINGIEGVVTMKVVTPQQQILFELSNGGVTTDGWLPFSRTFKTDDVPMECRIVVSRVVAGTANPKSHTAFKLLSLVSP